MLVLLLSVNVGVTSMVAIGILTYNALQLLKKCVDTIRRYTSADHEIWVADDGSTDGTTQWVADQQIGKSYPHAGVASNRNRILRHLFDREKYSEIIMVDDDAVVSLHGWEIPWISAAKIYGLCMYDSSHSSLGLTFRMPISGHCMSISRSCYSQVGEFDERYDAGWGYEDGDYVRRYESACRNACPTLSYGVSGGGSGRWCRDEELAVNRAIYAATK